LDRSKAVGIDIGLTNTATTSDGMIVKGGAIKSINQSYNKELARCKSTAKIANNKDDTKKIKKLARVRGNKVHDKMHQASRRIIDHCIEHGAGTIYIGYNPGWKDGIHIGHRGNQNFVQVPFLKLIKQIEYKAALAGISVHRVNEAFTSQACSRCGARRKANRVHRGLYVCSRCGIIINADINAARNIKEKGLRETPLVGETAAPVADRSGMSPPLEITAAG